MTKISSKLVYLIKKAYKEQQEQKIKRRTRKLLESAYPDYSKSLLRQLTVEPEVAGRRRALTTGALAAILGALAARVISNKPNVVLSTALASGLLGAIPGYISGKREAESEKSKLLFLRRLGISRPGELETLLQSSYEPASEKTLEEGVAL